MLACVTRVSRCCAECAVCLRAVQGGAGPRLRRDSPGVLPACLHSSPIVLVLTRADHAHAAALSRGQHVCGAGDRSIHHIERPEPNQLTADQAACGGGEAPHLNQRQTWQRCRVCCILRTSRSPPAGRLWQLVRSEGRGGCAQ